VETVPIPALHAWLRARSAVFQPDRSGAAHVYWSAPMRTWFKVVRSGPTHVKVTAHATCPCSSA